MFQTYRMGMIRDRRINIMTIFGQHQAMAIALGTALLFSGCGVGTGSSESALIEVNSLGELTVGQAVPGYVGGPPSGRGMGPKPSRGDYLVHVLHPDLPPTCVDEECGDFGAIAKQRGVQVFGGSDLKLADGIFGIFSATTSEEFQAQSQDYGVVVISDKHGKILSIFNEIELSDVAKIIKAKNLKSS
jgi:hypothetical protein